MKTDFKHRNHREHRL